MIRWPSPQPDSRVRTWREQTRVGSDIDLGDLFYHGERSTARDYLSSQGWHVTVHLTEEQYAAHGFEFPDDDLLATLGDSGYMTATLT